MDKTRFDGITASSDDCEICASLVRLRQGLRPCYSPKHSSSAEGLRNVNRLSVGIVHRWIAGRGACLLESKGRLGVSLTDI